MDNLLLKLKKYWKSFELRPYRPANGTYSPYLWSEIPLLQQKFSGTFKWLPEAIEDKQKKLKKLHGQGKLTAQNFSKQMEDVQKNLKITFPEDFTALMKIPSWQDSMTFSPTASFFPEKIEVQPFLSGHITTIYRDQQDVVQWFLYFESDPKKCKESIVLSSPASLEEILRASPADLLYMLEIAEESYEAFIYRMNLENLIWQKLDDPKLKISVEWQKSVDQYLDFYDDKKWTKIFEKLSEKQLQEKLNDFDPAILVKYKPLSEDFLTKNIDHLPLVYVSHYQQLSEKFIQKFANQLDWQIMSIKQKLSPATLVKFADRIDWLMASYYQQLSFDLIEKFKDKLNWNYVLMNQDLPLEFFEKYKEKIDWRALSYSPKLSEEVLKKYADKLDWQLISQYTPLSENLIKNFADRINWNTISQYQKLSENFIREYSNKLNWWLLSSYQKLSEDFIEEYKYKVLWDNLLRNPNVSEEFKQKNQNRSKEIAQELAALSEDDIRKNIDKFDVNLIYRTKPLSENFLEDFDDRIFWHTIAQFQPLSENLIRKHQNQVNWTFISMNQKLTEAFVDEFQYKIDWYNIQQNPYFSAEFKEKNKNRGKGRYQNISEEELRKYAKDFTPYQFNELCESRQLSEQFLEDFQDKINWFILARYQKLSENFIRKYQDKLNWWDVSALPLSEDFIREFKNKVEWKIIKQCQKNLSKKFQEECKDKLRK